MATAQSDDTTGKTWVCDDAPGTPEQAATCNLVQDTTPAPDPVGRVLLAVSPDRPCDYELNTAFTHHRGDKISYYHATSLNTEVTLHVGVNKGDTVTGTVTGSGTFKVSAIVAEAQAQISTAVSLAKSTNYDASENWYVPRGHKLPARLDVGAQSQHQNWTNYRTNANCSRTNVGSGDSNLPDDFPHLLAQLIRKRRPVRIAFAAAAAVALAGLVGCTGTPDTTGTSSGVASSSAVATSSAPTVSPTSTPSSPSSSTSTPAGATSGPPGPSPTDVTQNGDRILAHQSGVGPGKLAVPSPPKGTVTLLAAVRCDKGGSVDLVTKGKPLLSGNRCDNGAVFSVRSGLGDVDVTDMSIRVNAGTAWQAWIWSGRSR